MKNIPNKIYLQIGEETPKDTDFNDLGGVSWSKDRIYTNDIVYILQEVESKENSCKYCHALGADQICMVSLEPTELSDCCVFFMTR